MAKTDSLLNLIHNLPAVPSSVLAVMEDADLEVIPAAIGIDAVRGGDNESIQRDRSESKRRA